MKAIGYKTAGDVEVLTDIEIPRPAAGPRDLLVKVQAVSVNPVDTKRRRWETPVTDPDYMLLVRTLASMRSRASFHFRHQ